MADARVATLDAAARFRHAGQVAAYLARSDVRERHCAAVARSISQYKKFVV